MTTVLVVDDSAVDRRLVGALLAREPEWKVEYAEDGSEALTRIKESVPDLVLTDLQMPELDGLDLVTLARQHYPHLPVVLMTAYGSEALALEALERGAANYIPKTQIVDRLADTVKEVLSLARASRNYQQVIPSLSGTKLTFVLENDAALIDPLVDLVQQIAVDRRLCQFSERLQIGVALKEAMLNAIYHGNLEITFEQMQEVREKLSRGETCTLIEDRRSQSQYRERGVFVEINLTPEEVRFVIRDEGPGFDVKSLPPPRKPATLEATRGRGVSLMHAFMHDVIYNDAGNEVTLVKRRGATADKPQEGTEEVNSTAVG